MGAATLAILCTLGARAAAEEDRSLYDRLWPELPSSSRLTLSEQLTDQLTELGNTLGYHVDQLSLELVRLQFDGRRRRARIRFGSQEGDRFLTFKLAGDVHFTHGVARVRARLDLGVAGHVVQLELPDFEMAPSSYLDRRGVEVRVPLFRRSF